MNQSLSFAPVPSIALTFTYLILPVSLVLTSFLIHSLKSLPLSKQSLIVRMYQDSLSVNVLLVIFWSFVCTLWMILDDADETYKHKAAEIIAFLDQELSLTLVLNLLTIGIFRILRVRYKILDPFSIWIDDESKSLGIIRGITIVLGLLVNILIYVSFTI